MKVGVCEGGAADRKSLCQGMGLGWDIPLCGDRDRPIQMESTVSQPKLMPTRSAGDDLAARPQLTVLLVEDNLSTLAIFSHVLKEQGYQVWTAETYDDAQRICDQFPGPIHLLVTDVLLPKKEELQLSAARTRPAAHSGFDLARHMTAKRRGTRVLFMTGRTDEELKTMTRGLPTKGWAVLRKPFGGSTLMQAVEEVMKHPPAGTQGSDRG